ncbi:MAG: hypothetical protein JWP75_4040 [Frondihabitans sp.]|nr:hypothetical protein [Frondihabitans sp.]
MTTARSVNPRFPYIILTTLSGGTGERLASWLALRATLVAMTDEGGTIGAGVTDAGAVNAGTVNAPSGLDVLDETTGEIIMWRLFTAQHRQLGASARLFSTPAEARADALEVTALRSTLVRHRTVTADGRKCSWILSTGRAPVMLTTRLFESRYDCNRNLQSALTALETAEVARGLDTVVRGHLDTGRRFPPKKPEAAPR